MTTASLKKRKLDIVVKIDISLDIWPLARPRRPFQVRLETFVGLLIKTFFSCKQIQCVIFNKCWHFVFNNNLVFHHLATPFPGYKGNAI